MYVVTADQIRSRTGKDRVPSALQALGLVEPGRCERSNGPRATRSRV